MSQPEDGRSAGGVRLVPVDEAHEGQRLDNFLLTKLKGVPRSMIYRIVRKGEVRVNGGRAQVSRRLQIGDTVRIPPVRQARQEVRPVAGEALRKQLSDNILLETDRFLVLNKPVGLAVHGGSGVSLGLIEALRQSRPDARFLELVHRLDRDTSGCLLIAKRRQALTRLQDDFRHNRVEKTYLALVRGKWPADLTRLDVPLKKFVLPSGERQVRVHKDGKLSSSRFSRRAYFQAHDISLIEIQLETGRTHQIRVQCQFAGHPIIGDTKYGDDALNRKFRQQGHNRLYLHAESLVFPDPEQPEVAGELIRVQAPVDGKWQEAQAYFSREESSATASGAHQTQKPARQEALQNREK